MYDIKLFLASSIVEFKHERNEIAARIRGKNDSLKEHGVYLKLGLCEDFSQTWAQGNKQEEFNAFIRDCHFFFAIVGKDVGDATQEEIDTALKQFRESGSLQQPRIIVFFQDLPDEEKSAKVFQLQAQVRQAGQYAVYFSNVEKIYGEILSEVFTSDAYLNQKALEANRKSHFANILKIRSNRAKIKKLSKTPVTDDTEAELMALYGENAALTELERVEWGTLYEYAAFLHKRGYHAKAAEVGARLDKHYTADDKPDERAELKRLLGDCQMSQGEREAAEPYYRDALTLYRELAERKGKYRADAAEMCVKLAEIMLTTFRYEAAERLYRDALAFYLGDAEGYAREIGLTCRAMQKLMGPRRKEQAEILRRAEQTALYCAVQSVRGRMGDVRENLRRWMETYPCPDSFTPRMKAAEAQALEATKDKPEDYERALMEICWNTADWLRRHNQMEAAEAFARKALEICRSLAMKFPGTFERNVAVSLDVLAWIMKCTNRPCESEQYYQAEIEIDQRLVKQNLNASEPDLARDFNNLGTLLTQTKRYEEAERHYWESLETINEQIRQFDENMRSTRTKLLKLSVIQGLSSGFLCNFSNLLIYRLEIYRRLAKHNPDAFEADLSKAHLTFGNLLFLVKRYEEAERYYREALEVCQRRAKQDPGAFEPDLALSCMNLAILLENTKRYEEAERYYRESLELYRKLAKQDPGAFEPDLATACYNYGIYLLDYRHDPDAAKAYLDKAIALYEKYPHYQKDLDDAISVRSRCQRDIYSLQYGRGS